MFLRRAPASSTVVEIQVWDGGAANLQNSVFHVTANFQGTSLTNSALTVDLHANFGATFNANGSMTALPTNVTCS